jgi:hypothetical protein
VDSAANEKMSALVVRQFDALLLPVGELNGDGLLGCP